MSEILRCDTCDCLLDLDRDEVFEHGKLVYCEQCFERLELPAETEEGGEDSWLDGHMEAMLSGGYGSDEY